MKMLDRGNTAEVFEYGEGKVCKLFFSGYPAEYVRLEFKNAEEMFCCGIRVPKPFEIVEAENRYGIIYERISGKTMYQLMVQDNSRLDELLDIFVGLQLDILSHRSQNLLSYKEYLTTMLKNKNVADKQIFSEINALPDDDCVLHGDFHPGNILMPPSEAPVIIDFMNVCCGPAQYDIARTFFLLGQFDNSLAERYLSVVEVPKSDIEQYLGVIEYCRKYEG